MKLQYYLPNSAGYEQIRIIQDDFCKEYYIDECLGDRLDELIGGILGLTGYYADMKIGRNIEYKYLEGSPDDTFEWKADIGSIKSKFIFELTEKPGILRFKIMEYDYIEDDCEEDDEWEEKCVFDNEISIDEIIDDLLQSCDQVLKKYGLIGYNENCWNAFPIFNYLLLKNYKHRKIKFIKFDEMIDGEKEQMHKTDILQELSCIMDRDG